MTNDNNEQLKFLEQQLEWSKKQTQLLNEIDKKLHEMKGIAEFALEHELSEMELNDLNDQLAQLKKEVQFLEKQLYTIYH